MDVFIERVLKKGYKYDRDDESMYMIPLSEAQIDDNSHLGMTLMHIAAAAGNDQVMQQLYAKCKKSTNALDTRGGSPLLEAAAGGHLKCVEWLVSVGADINFADARGDTALHLAAGFNHLELMKWLIENGANIDARTHAGVTPLLYATAKGNLGAVQLLVEAGTNLTNKEKERGWGVIHTAIGCNQLELAEWLITNFPDLVDDLSEFGLTPMQIATNSRNPDAVLLLEKSTKTLKKGGKKRKTGNSKTERRSLSKVENMHAQSEIDRIAKEILQDFGENKSSAKSKPKNRNVPKREKKPAPKEEAQRVIATRRVPARIRSDSPLMTHHGGCETSTDDEKWVQVVRKDRRKHYSNLSRPSLDSYSSSGSDSGVVTPKSHSDNEDETLPPQNLSPTKSTGSHRWTLGGKGTDERPSSRNGDTSPESLLDSPSREDQAKGISRTGSTLRPHAPPWSPKRRMRISESSESVKASDASDIPSHAVDNEFQRMLSKFTHMDTGARLTAKKKFAKQTQEYEKKRLADAEKVEQTWLTSLRTRMENGLEHQAILPLLSALAEIDEARIEAPPTSNQSDLHFLREDHELIRLVHQSMACVMQQYHISTEMSTLICVNQPQICTSATMSDFRMKLQCLIDLHQAQCYYSYLYIRVETFHSFIIPVAVECGFDFAFAGPGFVCMILALNDGS